MVLGGGLLRGDGHEGGALVASISALIKTTQRDSGPLLPWEAQRDDNCLSQEADPHQEKNLQRELLISRTGRNTCWLFTSRFVHVFSLYSPS